MYLFFITFAQEFMPSKSNPEHLPGSFMEFRMNRIGNLNA